MLVWQAQQSATISQLRIETGAWQLGQEQIEMLSSISIVSEELIRTAPSAIEGVSETAGVKAVSGEVSDVSSTGNGPGESKSKRGISTGWERLSTFNEDE